MSLRLFDTHTHFDMPDFNPDRIELAYLAKTMGVQHLVLIGLVAERFDALIDCQKNLNQLQNVPHLHLAPGLHPFYIEQHQPEHLQQLEAILKTKQCVAIAEIGLDTFLKQHKQADIFAKQQHYFIEQLALAQQYEKPVLLHIRKSHADVLKILKQQKFKHGGIAHAFSGGVEEAKAFIQLGFKIGVTGQVSNPNAKKLHAVIQAIGAEHLVLETDCPDMTPLCCQLDTNTRTRNTPGNLIYVLDALASCLDLPKPALAELLWRNSFQALALQAIP